MSRPSEEHRCDMCVFYDMEDGYCSRYSEIHNPEDGAYCGGWEHYEMGLREQEIIYRE